MCLCFFKGERQFSVIVCGCVLCGALRRGPWLPRLLLPPADGAHAHQTRRPT